jgi:hypothetical protein
MMSLSKLCSPALLYFVIAAISIVGAIFTKFQPLSIMVKTLFVLFWTWFLNFLCNKGHTGIAWFLVLLPFILLIVVGVIALEVGMKAKK